ncbi:MAG: hypothetical protein A2Y62_20005 [Candidatus Fischerbacteria bacterium RBG_13_37_8]|uniref:Glycosyltransferase RgtA/B/C/D-like domain-containing protein n=1 Tax=Candidatus Fischerbacteria bacterium RBG_13_37_8 TaxID=1817863 RepID=A0A1F5VU96_9BACT|nr:MAG: hypothetical protein A2Y62_20005 [Candidatus Fischerbacteria bacterium RBG_13_37_8]
MSKKKEKRKKKEIQQTKIIKRNYHWLNYVLIVAGAVVSLYMRIAPNVKYFMPEIPFRDPDTCYHLRRIIYVATHQMHLPFYDPLLDHPNGGIPMWSPLYDWLSALPAFVIGWGNPSPLLVQQISLILTLLFGFAALFFIGLLIYKATKNLTTAILASLFSGLTDAQNTYTSAEYIDHNSLVMLLYVIILYVTFAVLSKQESPHAFKDEGLLSVLVALLFWVWPGSYLHCSVLVVILLFYAWLSKRYQLFRYWSIVYAGAAILVAPLAYIHYHLGRKPLGYEYVSFFTVLFLFGISAGMILLDSLFRWRTSARKNVLLLAIIGSAIILIALFLLISAPLIEGIQFARAENIWLSTVWESKPLFYEVLEPIKFFTVNKAVDRLNYLVFIFPLAFLVVLLRRVKIPTEFYAIVVVNGMLFGYLAWVQQRFVFDFAVPYGMILSLGCVWLYWKIVKKFSLVLAGIFCFAIIMTMMPLKKDFKEVFTPMNAFYSTFTWLKNDAKLEGTEINTGHSQPIGVMTPWDFGHHLHLYGEMPTVEDNFGINVGGEKGLIDMAKFFLSTDEESAIALLKQYKVTYIFVPLSSVYEQFPQLIGEDPGKYYQFSIVNEEGKKRINVMTKPYMSETIGFRLSDMLGSSNPSNDENKYDFKALKHFRLLYVSPEATVARQPVFAGSLKIYTYTDGTPLQVNAEGNPEYKLVALVRTNRGLKFWYRQKGNVNDGIIAPYPTHPVMDYPYAQYYTVYIGNQVYTFKDVR